MSFYMIVGAHRTEVKPGNENWMPIGENSHEIYLFFSGVATFLGREQPLMAVEE